MAYLKDFQERIYKNDYPGFLKLWEEYCYIDEPNEEEFLKILETVKNSELSSSFGHHVEKGLTVWKLLKTTKHIHQVLKLIFDIQKTNSENLLQIAISYLENKYPNDPLFSEKLRLIGLRGGESFQGAISNYELLTHMEPGKYVFHKAGWGTCEIVDISLIREEITMECDLVVGQKMLSFSNAFHTLVPIPNDHFLARRFGNPDLLEKQAKEDPVEIIQVLLRDLGPKTAYEVKEELLDLVIPEKDWNRWWQSARSKLKKDTKIQTPTKLRDPFVLLENEISLEKSFQTALEKKPGVNETIQMIYTFIRDFPETLKNQEFKQSLEERLKDVLSAETLKDHHKIQIYYFLIDLHSLPEKELLKELIQNTSDFQDLIKLIEVISFKKRTLIEIQQHKENWQEIFLSLFFIIELNMLRDYILTELQKTKDQKRLEEKIKDLLDHPVAYPDALVWYFQKVVGKKEKLPFSDRLGQAKLFENFLILLAKISDRPALKELGKKMVNILTNNRYKIVRDIMEKSTIEEAREYLLLSTKCNLFSDHDVKIIHSLAEVVHPSLSTMRKSELETSSQEDIIWTTQEGYLKIQKRISEIATVETVQNAKEIEEARALGDLRENAEFKAALEKRDRLQSELKLLSDQINKARIILPEEVITKEISIGTSIECEDSKGNKIVFSILGPWDANPEEHVVSFQSKIAKSMIGKKVGDDFSFQNEQYFIKNIFNYFEQK